MALIDWAHRIDLSSEIQEIYLHRFLFTLAINTVAIFLPFYVYQQAGSPAAVFAFFALYYAMFIVLVWPVARLTARIGYKHASLLSSPFILGFYIVLRLSSSIRMTYLAGIIGGIGFITYWIGMNSEMARNSHSGHRSQEAGVFFSMPKLAAVISPLFGGLVLNFAGFEALFALAAGLVTLSYAPFLLSSEHFSGMEAAPRTVFNRRHAVDFIAYMFRGIAGLYRKVLWPLYLAIIIGGSLNIGGAGSIMALGGALAGLVLGRKVTPGNRKQVMIGGAIITAGTYIASAFVTNAYTAFVVSFLNGVMFLTVTIPLYSAVMTRASEEDIIEYFAFREIGLCTGRIMYLLVMYGVFTRYGIETAFIVGFGLLAVSGIIGAVAGERLPAE